MYLIIDVETSGLPITKGFDKWHSPELHEYYDTARLVQIAWKVLDEQYNEKWSENYIVKRDNFSIKNHQFHGITDEISDEKGISLDSIFEKLFASLLECEYIIAHNIGFDENVILNHTFRINDQHLRKRWMSMKRLCTMKLTQDILKLPKKYSYTGYKYPSLKELYYYYFKDSFDGAHDAMNDVNACAKCFVEYEKQRTVL